MVWVFGELPKWFELQWLSPLKLKSSSFSLWAILRKEIICLLRVGEGCTRAGMPVEVQEQPVVVHSLFFYHVGLGDRIQVIRHGSRHLYLLSHLLGSRLPNLNNNLDN